MTKRTFKKSGYKKYNRKGKKVTFKKMKGGETIPLGKISEAERRTKIGKLSIDMSNLMKNVNETDDLADIATYAAESEKILDEMKNLSKNKPNRFISLATKLNKLIQNRYKKVTSDITRADSISSSKSDSSKSKPKNWSKLIRKGTPRAKIRSPSTGRPVPSTRTSTTTKEEVSSSTRSQSRMRGRTSTPVTPTVTPERPKLPMPSVEDKEKLKNIATQAADKVKQIKESKQQLKNIATQAASTARQIKQSKQQLKNIATQAADKVKQIKESKQQLKNVAIEAADKAKKMLKKSTPEPKPKTTVKPSKPIKPSRKPKKPLSTAAKNVKTAKTAAVRASNAASKAFAIVASEVAKVAQAKIDASKAKEITETQTDNAEDSKKKILLAAETAKTQADKAETATSSTLAKESASAARKAASDATTFSVERADAIDMINNAKTTSSNSLKIANTGVTVATKASETVSGKATTAKKQANKSKSESKKVTDETEKLDASNNVAIANEVATKAKEIADKAKEDVKSIQQSAIEIKTIDSNIGKSARTTRQSGRNIAASVKASSDNASRAEEAFKRKFQIEEEERKLKTLKQPKKGILKSTGPQTRRQVRFGKDAKKQPLKIGATKPAAQKPKTQEEQLRDTLGYAVAKQLGIDVPKPLGTMAKYRPKSAFEYKDQLKNLNRIKELFLQCYVRVCGGYQSLRVKVKPSVYEYSYFNNSIRKTSKFPVYGFRIEPVNQKHLPSSFFNKQKKGGDNIAFTLDDLLKFTQTDDSIEFLTKKTTIEPTTKPVLQIMKSNDSSKDTDLYFSNCDSKRVLMFNDTKKNIECYFKNKKTIPTPEVFVIWMMDKIIRKGYPGLEIEDNKLKVTDINRDLLKIAKPNNYVFKVYNKYLKDKAQ